MGKFSPGLLMDLTMLKITNNHPLRIQSQGEANEKCKSQISGSTKTIGKV
jgi:hypothetical protein